MSENWRPTKRKFKNKATNISISMEEETLKRFFKWAEKRHLNRSEFVTDLIVKAMNETSIADGETSK